MEDCNICCEKFNKTTRKEIKCNYCEFSSCLGCFKRYILDLQKNACCMSCKRELPLDFISKNTPISFSNNEYRNKRAADLLSQEKSLLPSSQNLVEQRKNEIHKQKLLDELKEEETYLRHRLREIAILKNDIRYGNTKVEEKEKKTFIMSCADENCRGFVSSAWKCGICDKYTCSKCHKLKNSRDDEEHVCNKDDVATADMIKKETKPCPKCRAPIFKISGCDLMWCTVCHVTFSWNKNEIVSVKHNHNPHFYAFQREQNNGEAPRVPGDDPCGMANRLPNFNHMRDRLYNEFGDSYKLYREIHRTVYHINDVLLPRFPNEIGIQDNSDLRVNFLMKDISEEEWLKQLKIRQKKSEKNRAINLIFNMLVDTITDIFVAYNLDRAKDIDKQFENLRLYVNREFAEINRLFKNRTFRINKKWEIVSN